MGNARVIGNRFKRNELQQLSVAIQVGRGRWGRGMNDCMPKASVDGAPMFRG